MEQNTFIKKRFVCSYTAKNEQQWNVLLMSVWAVCYSMDSNSKDKNRVAKSAKTQTILQSWYREVLNPYE